MSKCRKHSGHLWHFYHRVFSPFFVIFAILLYIFCHFRHFDENGEQKFWTFWYLQHLPTYIYGIYFFILFFKHRCQKCRCSPRSYTRVRKARVFISINTEDAYRGFNSKSNDETDSLISIKVKHQTPDHGIRDQNNVGPAKFQHFVKSCIQLYNSVCI